jgi:hypothetical protein
VAVPLSGDARDGIGQTRYKPVTAGKGDPAFIRPGTAGTSEIPASEGSLTLVNGQASMERDRPFYGRLPTIRTGEF